MQSPHLPELVHPHDAIIPTTLRHTSLFGKIDSGISI